MKQRGASLCDLDFGIGLVDVQKKNISEVHGFVYRSSWVAMSIPIHSNWADAFCLSEQGGPSRAHLQYILLILIGGYPRDV